jgi:hypothetical protein
MFISIKNFENFINFCLKHNVPIRTSFFFQNISTRFLKVIKSVIFMESKQTTMFSTNSTKVGTVGTFYGASAL